MGKKDAATSDASALQPSVSDGKQPGGSWKAGAPTAAHAPATAAKDAAGADPKSASPGLARGASPDTAGDARVQGSRAVHDYVDPTCPASAAARRFFGWLLPPA